MHVVARAQRAVGVDHELGHDEQADALHAFGRAGHARQHQVHDVLGHVVLAVGDEDLGAEDLVACRRPAARRGVRTSARSLPACGSVRFIVPVHSPAIMLRQIDRCLSSSEPAVSSASIAPSVSSGHSAKLRLALLMHLDAGGADRLGQALAAELAGMLQALPAALGVLAEGLLEARRGRDHAVLPRRRVAGRPRTFSGAITSSLKRGAFLEHRLRGLEAGFLEAGQRGDLRRGRRVPSCRTACP